MALTKKTIDRFNLLNTQFRFVGFTPMNKYEYIDNWTKLELKKFHKDDLDRLYVSLTKMAFDKTIGKQVKELVKKVRTRVIEIKADRVIAKQKGVTNG
jgi:hypothetical protein